MADPLPPNPDERKPPLIPLDYHVPQRTPLRVPSMLAFIGGLLLGFVGLAIGNLYYGANNFFDRPSIPGDKSGAIFFEFLVAGVSVALLVWMLGTPRRRSAFLMGLLVGLCLAGLLGGLCFGS